MPVVDFDNLNVIESNLTLSFFLEGRATLVDHLLLGLESRGREGCVGDSHGWWWLGG
jgi:hypothetical protein